MKRVFLIVLDSVGIGEMPDADEYGDAGSNTIAAAASSPSFSMPNMQKLGFFNIDGVDCREGSAAPAGAFARLTERSKGKDTTIGHWEIAGLVSEQPLPTFPDGFPKELLDEFEKETGRKVLCNKPYSGTEVIKDFGEEHRKTGALIVYTSADSVFQIAAHEEIVPIEELYRYCEIARRLCTGKFGVGRVIARPFEGEYPFSRTSRRHDYSLEPPKATMLNYISGAGKEVLAVGKINDIFAGSGVGKSTLLGMFARNTKADINVIALIGERGREVREFVERDLGPEGMKRSVLVVATSDKPALIRNKAAKTATAIAEYFRDQGKDVLLMMDSLTRFSMAQREIGLASGEPPVTRGYPPSVYSEMPKLLERAGMSAKGSITGLYTVLVDGDDFNEPITDTARSILDGHIMLSRKLGHKNHYPAIDILQSISRVMNSIVTKEHKALAGKLKQVLATYSEAEDLINIGAYKNGSNPDIDYAIRKNKEVNEFLCQDTEEKFAFDEEVELLKKVFDD